MWVNILKTLEDDRQEKRYEELSFSGDHYIWREDGARKMLEPWPDEEWDLNYCDECRRASDETSHVNEH